MNVLLSVSTIDNQLRKQVTMLTNPFVIGRSDSCNLQLESRSVSRLHCELKIKQSRLTVKDLGSRNGTLVNKRFIDVGSRVLIEVGDLITIGKFRIGIESIDLDALRLKVSKATDVVASVEEGDLLAEFNKMLEASREENDHFVSHKQDLIALNTNSSGWKSVSPNKEPINVFQLTESEESSATSSDFTTRETTTDIVVNGEAAEDARTAITDDQRRDELRKRIQQLKAKDSREAADNALKRLFGRR